MAHKLLTDNILPLIFNKDGCKFVSCEFDFDSVGEDQFQSRVIFLTASVAKGGERREIPLVMKFEPSNEEVRKSMKTGVQFYVEVLMYDKILQFLNRNGIVEDCFARFYHGVGFGDEKFVALEDLRPRGYRLAEEKAFIDYKHLALAMAKLGRFHALSFAKKEFPDEFFNLMGSLQETTWIEDNTFFCVLKACIHRAVDPLLELGKHVEILTKFLDRIDNSFCDFMLELVASVEPMAVLCHGDFCRNNILFKYRDDQPTDAKLFDVATARYSSPMIDISFFLLLNSSPQVRRAHWNDLLCVYHQALSTAVPGTDVPSLEDVRREVTEKALYGFIHCSHFLPFMLFNGKTFSGTDDADSLVQEEAVRELTLLGGEAGTTLMSDMVEELIERGCLTLQHPFLQNR